MHVLYLVALASLLTLLGTSALIVRGILPDEREEERELEQAMQAQPSSDFVRSLSYEDRPVSRAFQERDFTPQPALELESPEPAPMPALAARATVVTMKKPQTPRTKPTPKENRGRASRTGSGQKKTKPTTQKQAVGSRILG